MLVKPYTGLREDVSETVYMPSADPLEVVLIGNASGGYMWSLVDDFDKDLFGLVDIQTEPLEQYRGGPIQHYIFKTAEYQAGNRSTLHFVYKRSWEKKGLKEYYLEVVFTE